MVKSALSTLAAAVELLAATGIVLEQVERLAEQQVTEPRVLQRSHRRSRREEQQYRYSCHLNGYRIPWL